MNRGATDHSRIAADPRARATGPGTAVIPDLGPATRRDRASSVFFEELLTDRSGLIPAPRTDPDRREPPHPGADHEPGLR